MSVLSLWKRLFARSEEDAELDRLLANGNLGGAQYDSIEARVMAELSPPREPEASPRTHWSWLAPGLALASALGAFLLLGGERDDALQPRGETTRALPVSVGCGGDRPARCRLGQTLTFAVPPQASGYLLAYAERVGDPAAPRIWYFPSAAGSAPRVAPADQTRVLPRGVRLGAPHVPGRYRVTAWLHPSPPTRGLQAPATATRVVVEVQASP